MTAKRCEKEEDACVNVDVGHLLYRLKITIERVLLSRAAGVGGNVWLAYGGLVDLVVNCLGEILRNGVKSKVRDDEPILEWLRASLESDPDHPIDTVDQWIRDCLLQFCLRDQFVRLLHNRTLVEEIYCPDAFLRLPQYVESLFSCLQSLEEQQHKFLTDIDPLLYLHSVLGKSLAESRSLSFPVLATTVHKFTSLASMECCADFGEIRQSSQPNPQCDPVSCAHCVMAILDKLITTVSSHVQDQQQHQDSRSLDRSGSQLSIDSSNSKSQTQSSTLSRTAIKKNPVTSVVANHRRTRSDDVFLRKLPLSRSVPITGDLGGISATSSRHNLAESQRMGSGELIKESMVQAAKLREYIAQREYETSLELERENAHFLLSEMLIGAIEQMKWRNVLSTQLPTNRCASSDQHSNPPNLRRPEEEFASTSCEAISDSSGDIFLSSSSDLTGSWSRDLASSSYEGTDLRSDINATFGMGTGDQGTSSGTESTGFIREPLETRRHSSAEAVAMNLLQSFSRKHLPQSQSESSELKFLVSYKDVPQLLLPLPQSMPVAPDEVYAEGFKQKVKLRGTFEWAPPRPQLVFKLHPVPKLKPLLERQAFKCAGCGMKLDKAYFKRLRYCAYLGRLFCQCCHQGQTATIPAHILHKWDFHRLPVSDFSYRFLNQQFTAPVWNVKAANAALYDHVKQLRAIRNVRQQLKYCYDYVRTCRLAKELITTNGRLVDVFENMPSHWTQEIDVYSMQDFAQVKDGSLYTKLDAILLLARYHIEGCQFCVAKGFVCEICRKDEILFPFQATSRVRRCPGCGSCFHTKCLRKRDCPKCRRMQSRRDLATENILEQEDELDT